MNRVQIIIRVEHSRNPIIDQEQRSQSGTYSLLTGSSSRDGIDAIATEALVDYLTEQEPQEDTYSIISITGYSDDHKGYSLYYHMTPEGEAYIKDIMANAHKRAMALLTIREDITRAVEDLHEHIGSLYHYKDTDEAEDIIQEVESGTKRTITMYREGTINQH